GLIREDVEAAHERNARRDESRELADEQHHVAPRRTRAARTEMDLALHAAAGLRDRGRDRALRLQLRGDSVGGLGLQLARDLLARDVSCLVLVGASTHAPRPVMRASSAPSCAASYARR